MSNAQSNPPTQSDEQSFHILPHPARSNDPADLQGGGASGGICRSDAPAQAFHARDPYVPSQQIRDNMPPAASREELEQRQAQLNKLSG